MSAGRLALASNGRFAPRWSAKVEYLYVDLGDEILPLFVAPVSVDFSTVRFGVNYRF